MTTYSVLPSIPLDPRNEADLVIAAAQKVFEASNGRLNNFSPGSPTMALIEGQAYAGSELLYHLNQLPEAIILEWLGSLLGIQRRLGTPSKANLEINIAPHNSPWVLKAGFIVRSNTSITGEDEILFTTDDDLIIPAGSTQGFITITSINVGSDQNVDANIVTEFEESLAFLRSVRNITPATGGTDEEDLIEIKQRAFSYIRRRNPVSKQDWQDYIINLLGIGSTVLVKNRRPEVERQINDALVNANHVTFFVLGPDNSVLSPAQLSAVQSKIDSHLPVNMQGHVYNINTQNVDINLTVSYNPAVRGGTLKSFSSDIYNSFIEYLQPNNYFDIGEPIQIWDLITLFAQDYAYASPNIEALTCYSAPADLSALSAQWKEWKTGEIYLKDELISSSGLFYQVLQNFDPIGTDPIDQVNDGVLQFNRVKDWTEFPHRLNDVIIDDGEYYLVLDSISGTDPSLGNAITTNKVSSAIDPVDWIAGASLSSNQLVYSRDAENNIIEYEMFVVKEDVTVVSTGTIADAELFGFISQVSPQRLQQGDSYTTGEYVFVANRFAGFDYYKVLNDFTYANLSSPLQEVYNGNIKNVIVNTTSPSTFRGRKYKARFETREYLELSDNNIYQVGKDFTPDDSTIVDMIADRRLYQTEFTTNPTSGSIGLFRMVDDGDGYLVELDVGTSIATPNISEFVTDGDGESIILQFDLDRNRFDISGVNIVSPGSDFQPLDLITIPARLTQQMEMDKPIYLQVTSVNPGGGVSGLVETDFQAASTTYLRRWNIPIEMLSYAADTTGYGAILRTDVLFNSPFSYRAQLTNFTLEDGGDKYKENELLYADFDATLLDGYFTLLEDHGVQAQVTDIRANFAFGYRQLHEFLTGDVIKFGDKFFTANKDFNSVVEGLQYYVNDGIITPLASPTQSQIDGAKELYGVNQTSNIPTPLIGLQGLVTFDNKASIYSTTTNAFDGDNGTFWASRERGSEVANVSYVGVDLGFEAYITDITFTNATSIDPLQLTSASFDIQYSLRGIYGPWITVATGSNSDAVQPFDNIDIQARYWRFIANGGQVPHDEEAWHIANIELVGDVFNIVDRSEDILVYTENNTTAFYRAMRTFTPDNGSNPREYELDGQLLKVVSRYENEQSILPRTDFSALDPGWMNISFHPHGSPKQITRYVIENKLGSNLVYSIEPGNNDGPITDYKTGTIAL